MSQGDVALLKVETTDMASSELAPDADVGVGQQIISVGYPGSTDKITDASMDPDNKDGTVSAKKTAGSVPVYETNAALSGGMSGGPTIGLDGKVVGINSRGPAGESQPFNFIAPASGLAELLNRNGVRAQLGPLDTQFRSGLDDYSTGHYTAAIATFDKILAVAPTYQQAAVFKTNAAKARDQFGDVSTSSSWKTILYVGVGLVGAVVLAAALLAIVLMRRRRNRRYPGSASAPGFPGGPNQGPPYTPGPIPVLNPAASAWTGAQSPAASVQQPGPPTGEGADHAPAVAPVTIGSGTERAGDDVQTLTAHTTTSDAVLYCPGCGAPHHENERFCPRCGYRIIA